MTSANPFLQNCAPLEKSTHWVQYKTKDNSATQSNISDKTYQPSQPHTMTIINDQTTPQKSPTLPNLQLDMEIFSDLSTYCKQPTTVTTSQNIQNSQDELNTPIFEHKAPFDFDRQTNVGSDNTILSMENPSAYKVKREINDHENIVLINENIAYPVGELSSVASNLLSYCSNTSAKGSDDNTSIVSNSPDLDSYTTVLSPDEVDYFSYNKKSILAPVKSEFKTSNCDYLNTETLMTTEDPKMIEATSSANFPTPENSRESTPALRFDFSQKMNNIDSIQTPDIMDALNFDYERDFNILNYINDEDIKAVANDLFPAIQEIPSSATTVPQEPEKSELSYSSLSSEETHNYALPPEEEERESGKKVSPRKRRMKKEEDDDEDYLPPSHKRTSRGGKTKRMMLDMEINRHILEELNKTKRRGRPPKSRVSSISSDSSEYLLIDTEESKYRDMRDKNNEASRRSRFKRKLKEMAVENEADELAEKNIKLKAQVEELEKTVTTFRSNLMKLLMSK